MDVTPLVQKGQQIIQAYAHGRFKVSGDAYESPIIVTPSETWVWDIDPPYDIKSMTAEDFSSLTAQSQNIDVVLFGCGERMTFMPSALKKDMKTQGLSMDIMDTGAACRTYNVLMAEGRRVACALLPVSAEQKK